MYPKQLTRLNGNLTRRQILAGLGALGGTVFASSLLAACGGDDNKETPATSGGDTTPEATTPSSAATSPAGSESSPTTGSSSEGSPAADETPQASGDAPAQGDGVYGGVFNAAVETAPPTLDIAITLAAAAREATLYWAETLVAYGEKYEIVPLVADSWEASDDGKSYTFTLRDATFSNGKVMTSEDIVASTKRFMDVTARKSSFEMVESWEAPDDKTFVFHLSYPTMTLLDALAYPVGSLVAFPKEVIEGKEAGKLANEDMIGTGPYKLAEWKPDQYLKLVRFEDYKPTSSERDGLGGGRIPYFDEINLIPVPEAAGRVAGLETGEYDYAASPATTEYDRLKENKDIKPYIIEDQRWIVILFNFRNEISKNLKFRQAVQAALDMDSLGMAVSNGRKEFFTVQPSMWFKSSPWHTEVGAELYNQKDIDKGKQLLQEAGYNNDEIVMVTNRNYDYMYKTNVTAAEQLKAIGMNTKVELLDWPAQQARWKEPDWQMSVTGYLSQGIFAPDAFGAFYGGGGADAGAGYSNADMTAAFEAAQKATTMEERKAAFEDVQRIWYEDVPGIKTVDTNGLTALRADIQGYLPWYNTTRFWTCWRED
jgi:peptide/nickel transport system substrate-binding protein